MSGKPTRSSVKSVSNTTRWILFAICCLISIVVLVFYGIIFIGAFSQAWGYDYSFTLRNFSYVWDVGYKTIKDTVTVALLSTPISGIMGMFIAFLVVRKSFLGKGAMEFTSMLSFALPGTVVGIGYILAFNQNLCCSRALSPFWWRTSCSAMCQWVSRTGWPPCSRLTRVLRRRPPTWGPTLRPYSAASPCRSFRPPFLGLGLCLCAGHDGHQRGHLPGFGQLELDDSADLVPGKFGALGAAAAFSIILVGIIVVAIVLIRVIVNRLLGVKFEAKF